jgi:hypothetical protein
MAFHFGFVGMDPEMYNDPDDNPYYGRTATAGRQYGTRLEARYARGPRISIRMVEPGMRIFIGDEDLSCVVQTKRRDHIRGETVLEFYGVSIDGGHRVAYLDLTMHSEIYDTRNQTVIRHNRDESGRVPMDTDVDGVHLSGMSYPDDTVVHIATLFEAYGGHHEMDTNDDPADD